MLTIVPTRIRSELNARYRRCPSCGELQPPGAMRIFIPPERRGSLRRQCIFCGHWTNGEEFELVYA